MVLLRKEFQLDYSHSATYCCKCRILAVEMDYNMQIGHKADNITEENLFFLL